MKKTKTKSRGLLKVVAAGFAFMLAGAFFPVNAIALAENYSGVDNVNANTNRIQVVEDGQQYKTTVKKGETVKVPVGEYYGKSTTAKQIGSDELAGSSVKVTYKGTGEVVLAETSNKTTAQLAALSFVANKVGTYVITYTVVDGENQYTYDYEVKSVVSDASFEFVTNSSKVIPSVYDTSIADGKDILLPLPKVNDENGKEILNGTEALKYTNVNTGNGFSDDEYFVYVNLTSGSDDITIEKKTGENGDLYVSGAKLAEKIATIKGQEFKVTYSLYQKKGDGVVFVTSTSKTFTVSDGYYYKDSAKTEHGFDITTSWKTTPADNAVVGVPKDLPEVTAKTKATNSPANEAVDVYYTVKVYKMGTDGKYTQDVTADVLKDMSFKAKEEGSYKFVYTVKDFYGNTAAETNTTFTIDNVKDTQAANVYMYDAGDYEVDEDGAYTTSETKLKTQTVARNIVMYAIAGSDNMVAADQIELRREVREGSYTRFVIGKETYQKQYNAYNLIFAPSKAEGESVYTQIVNDNYEIYRQMIIDGKDVTNANQVKAWLKANKYLLVTTNYNKDVDGNDIVANPAGNASEVNNDDITAILNAGYAYVPSEATNKQHTFSETTYNFYYFANDNKNNNRETSVYYLVKLDNSTTDSGVPTVTFATSLQTSYLPDEKITFTVADASDTVDTVASRINKLTAYRFLNSAKEAVESDTTTQTIQYVIAGQVNAKDSTKWYVTSQDANGLVESEGWYYDTTKTSYEVNLADAPATAKYLEILCYAVDDYGNVGFFNKVIKIADAEDSGMPVLYKVANTPEAIYEAQNQITLPTLYYQDAKAEYMHADVSVYKVTKTTETVNGEEVTTYSRKLMTASGMSTDVDTNRGVYIVNAGKFNASTEGTYQVAVSVKDAGNHSNTTYFTYKVVGGAVVEDPEIENITSETKELAVDEQYYLVPPTVAVSESDTYEYIGLDKTEDGNSATYYTTTMVAASSNHYSLDQYYFSASEGGTYKLQYNVFLIRYVKAAIGTNLRLEDGSLIYTESGEDYYVFFEKNDNGDYVLRYNTDKFGLGTELADTSEADTVVTGFALKSNVQTIKVDSVVFKSYTTGNAYERTQYETLGTELTIVKPEVAISGNGTLDEEDSTVQITLTSGSTTQTIATFSLAEWEAKVANNNNFVVNGTTIKLKLSKNGKYTIKYSLQAQDGIGQNVGDAKTLEYSIANGDVTKPTITLNKVAKTKYNLGDSLVIDMEGITVDDNVTKDVETLLKTLTVKLTNEDTSETWTLVNDGEEGQYHYEHKLDVAGNYTVTFTVKDAAGNTSNEATTSFTVETTSSNTTNVKEVLGGVLIGVSVAILTGVVAYFVVSKVKLDKKEKRLNQENKRNK